MGFLRSLFTKKESRDYYVGTDKIVEKKVEDISTSQTEFTCISYEANPSDVLDEADKILKKFANLYGYAAGVSICRKDLPYPIDSIENAFQIYIKFAEVCADRSKENEEYIQLLRINYSFLSEVHDFSEDELSCLKYYYSLKDLLSETRDQDNSGPSSRDLICNDKTSQAFTVHIKYLKLSDRQRKILNFKLQNFLSSKTTRSEFLSFVSHVRFKDWDGNLLPYKGASRSV